MFNKAVAKVVVHHIVAPDVEAAERMAQAVADDHLEEQRRPGAFLHQISFAWKIGAYDSERDEEQNNGL